MKIQMLLLTLLCSATFNSYARTDINSYEGTDIKVTADLNDHKARVNPVKSFDASKLSIKGIKIKMGPIQKHQVISIWCEGSGMGELGSSAFDVYYGNELNKDVVKLSKSNMNMGLKELCIKDMEEFLNKRR